MRGLGALALICGVMLAVAQNEAGVWSSIGGVIAFVISELCAWQHRSAQMWLEDDGEAWTVTDNRGSRDYSDRDVEACCLVYRDVYSNGEHQGVCRELRLWLDGESQPLVIATSIPLAQVDPIADFVKRIVERAKQEAEAALEHGRSIHGAGWSLNAAALTLERGGDSIPYRLDQLESVDSIDKHVCVWSIDEEQPIARIPETSQNATLLAMLLSERLAARPTKRDTIAEGDLGRVIFERKPSIGLVVVMYLAAVVLLIVSPLILLGADQDDRWFAVGAFVISFACAVWAIYLQTYQFRCYAAGVVVRSIFGHGQIFYKDVGRFTYSAVRHYHNGAYTGTHLSLVFDPKTPGVGQRINYSTSVQHADEALDNLRDHIARVIAADMATQLQAKKEVAWTDNITFFEDGFEFRPAGWVGRKEWQELAYSDVRGFDLQQGEFYLWKNGQEKPVFSESISAANFFPGFYLLVTLFSPPETEQAGVEEKQE